MDDRERLRVLSVRMLRLHKILLERERHAYEQRHGSVAPGALLRLLLHDEAFAWLRLLSALIAETDEVVDADEPVAPASAQRVFREVHRLLKSGLGGDFQERYHRALQESPDVVLAHADVSRILPTSRGA